MIFAIREGILLINHKRIQNGKRFRRKESQEYCICFMTNKLLCPRFKPKGKELELERFELCRVINSKKQFNCLNLNFQFYFDFSFLLQNKILRWVKKQANR